MAVLTSSPPVRTREYLIHLLTEAAEVEHNILCSYLYAAFSLKRKGEGLSPNEEAAVERWRSSLVSVAVEEMGHLVLVNNLIVSVGGSAHFDRPNLPAPAGYHPAGFIIRLTPFNRQTLEHFIFLERPEDACLADGAPFEAKKTAPARTQTAGHLTPSTPDYETIGAFYAEIRAALLAVEKLHGNAMFVGADNQIGADILKMPGVIAIHNMGDALAALETIVEQGEGASSNCDSSHFARFERLHSEWDLLLDGNAAFEPAHPAAQDPVMRRPEEGRKRVWITSASAARKLDLGNAIYGLTLKILQQCYANAEVEVRKALFASAIELMRALSISGEELARVPADEKTAVNAGLTFAVPRNLGSRSGKSALPMIVERLDELARGAADVSPAISNVVASARMKLTAQ